jgi:hypothetical protein
LLRLFIAFAAGWTFFILASNRDDYSNNRIVPPANENLLQAIRNLKTHHAAGGVAKPGEGPAGIDNGPIAGEEIPRVVYDPLAMNVELHGFDGGVPPSPAENRRIALPLRYVGRDDAETTRDIAGAFGQLERERKSGLVRKVVVHVVWPILLAGITLYMAAWAIHGYRQSRKG